MTTNDFLYEHGERIEELLSILEEEQTAEEKKTTCFNAEEMRIHMFLVSVQLLEEEKVCILGDLIMKKSSKKTAKNNVGNKAEQKKLPVVNTKLYKLLKTEVEQLQDSPKRDLIFLERVEAEKRNPYYFMEYVDGLMHDYKFLTVFWKFCDKHEVLHEYRNRSRMAI